MKKIILFFAAVMAMYSCSNEETFYPIETQQDYDFTGQPTDIIYSIGKHPSIWYYHCIFIDLKHYGGLSASLVDNIKIRVIRIHTDKGDVNFEQNGGIIGDVTYYNHNNPFAIQNIVDQYNDATIYSGRKLPYRETIVINPELTSQFEWMQLAEAEIEIRSADGTSVGLLIQDCCNIESGEAITKKGQYYWGWGDYSKYYLK